MGNDTSVPALQNPTTDICTTSYNAMRTNLKNSLDRIKAIDTRLLEIDRELAMSNPQVATLQAQLSAEKTKFDNYIKQLGSTLRSFGVQPTYESIITKILEFRTTYTPYTNCGRFPTYCQTYDNWIKNNLTPIENFFTNSLNRQRTLEAQISSLSVNPNAARLTQEKQRLQNEKNALDNQVTINESLRVIGVICD